MMRKKRMVVGVREAPLYLPLQQEEGPALTAENPRGTPQWQTKSFPWQAVL
jgi:hypothetical protein